MCTHFKHLSGPPRMCLRLQSILAQYPRMSSQNCLRMLRCAAVYYGSSEKVASHHVAHQDTTVSNVKTATHLSLNWSLCARLCKTSQVQLLLHCRVRKLLLCMFIPSLISHSHSPPCSFLAYRSNNFVPLCLMTRSFGPVPVLMTFLVKHPASHPDGLGSCPISLQGA